MKRRKNVLLLISMLLWSLVSTGSVLADTSGAYGDWLWSGAGNNAVVSFNLNFTNGAENFYLSNGSGSYLQLLDTEKFFDYSTISIQGKDVTINYNNTTTTYSNFLTSDNTFKFAFGQDPNYDYLYSWTLLTVNGSDQYSLTSQSSTIPVTFSTSTATPSAVPIPGTALLLGSSLLGLVGIGSRRKKA